jgi:hypothetical protein
MSLVSPMGVHEISWNGGPQNQSEPMNLGYPKSGIPSMILQCVSQWNQVGQLRAIPGNGGAPTWRFLRWGPHIVGCISLYIPFMVCPIISPVWSIMAGFVSFIPSGNFAYSQPLVWNMAHLVRWFPVQLCRQETPNQTVSQETWRRDTEIPG